MKTVLIIVICLLACIAPATEKNMEEVQELAIVKKEFCRLVDSGKLLERLKEQASTNINMPTMGGLRYWNNLIEYRGWRVQQHKLFENCRILTPDNRRVAWGTKSYVFKRIMGQPINTITNYMQQGNHLCIYHSSAEKSLGTVYLIHGWGVGSISMEWLAHEMNKANYTACCYDYRSSEQSLNEIASDLFSTLKKDFSLRQEPIFILTHSMGGLLMRKVLELDTDNSISGCISQIVMLGPPNNGSVMADIACAIPFFADFNHSISSMKYFSDSQVKNIGRPAHYTNKIGIIAGTRDMKVLPQKSIAIPGMQENIDFEIKMVNASHPGLRHSEEVLSLVLAYFQNGTFATD